MILEITCTKCHARIRFDVGDRDEAEAREWVKGQNCPGNHVELWQVNFWDYNSVNFVEGSAPSDEEKLEELRARYKYVYTADEFAKRGKCPFLIESFALGLCMAKSIETGKSVAFDFMPLPSGKRVYFSN